MRSSLIKSFRSSLQSHLFGQPWIICSFSEQYFLFFLKVNLTAIPDKSLVGGNVPKCITSTTKDTIIVYFIQIDKKKLPNIKCMSNSFFKYSSGILPGINSVPASSTHHWTWFIHYATRKRVLIPPNLWTKYRLFLRP